MLSAGKRRGSSSELLFAAPAVAIAIKSVNIGTNHADGAVRIGGSIAGAAGAIHITGLSDTRIIIWVTTLSMSGPSEGDAHQKYKNAHRFPHTNPKLTVLNFHSRHAVARPQTSTPHRRETEPLTAELPFKRD